MVLLRDTSGLHYRIHNSMEILQRSCFAGSEGFPSPACRDSSSLPSHAKYYKSQQCLLTRLQDLGGLPV